MNVYNLYIIKLLYNKKFIVLTNNYEKSLKKIFSSNNTNKDLCLLFYKPLYIEKIYENSNIIHKNKIITYYRNKYGYHNIFESIFY